MPESTHKRHARSNPRRRDPLWDEVGAEVFGRFLAEEIPRARDLVIRSGARAG